MSLEDQLLLRHVQAFEFGGLVDGIGFSIRVAREGCEGEMVLIKHYNDPVTDALLQGANNVIPPAILAERQMGKTGEYCWIPWHPTRAEHEDFLVTKIEDDREACELALQICEGKLKPQDLVIAWLHGDKVEGYEVEQTPDGPAIRFGEQMPTRIFYESGYLFVNPGVTEHFNIQILARGDRFRHYVHADLEEARTRELAPLQEVIAAGREGGRHYVDAITIHEPEVNREDVEQ